MSMISVGTALRNPQYYKRAMCSAIRRRYWLAALSGLKWPNSNMTGFTRKTGEFIAYMCPLSSKSAGVRGAWQVGTMDAEGRRTVTLQPGGIRSMPQRAFLFLVAATLFAARTRFERSRMTL